MSKRDGINDLRGPTESLRTKEMQFSLPEHGEIVTQYLPSRQPRWIVLGLITAIHLAALFALAYLDVTSVRQSPTVALAVNLMSLNPPPKAPAALPTRKVVERPTKPHVAVVAPPVMVTAAAPVPVHAAARPEPAPPAEVVAKMTTSTPPKVVTPEVNLSSRLLSGDPPRYPVESRRRQEIGTVVLMVLLDEEGRVSAISVWKSSGFARLDAAALGAVRRWRYSPTMVDGRASKVRGLVRMPFALS